MPTISPREILASTSSKPMEVVAASAPDQTPAPEVQAIQEPSVVEKPREVLDPRFAQLARKEKALRAQQLEIQKEKEALKLKHQEYETSYIPKSKLQEMAKTNPLQALEQLGLTPDEFTQALLNANPQDAAIQKLWTRLEEVENGNKQTRTQIEEQQKRAYDQAVTQIRNDLKFAVESDPKFETIKEADAKGWDATEGAVSLIEEIFTEGWPEKGISKGTVIRNDQALGYIQEWVLEKAYEMAQLKGVKEKFAPPAAPETPEVAPKPSFASQAQQQQQQQTRAPARTLTNTMNATKQTRLSDKERRDRAVAALMGQLN